MAEYKVGGVPKGPGDTPDIRAKPPEPIFGKIAMLGNAGAKIDRLLVTVAGGYVEGTHVPVPVEKKLAEVVKLGPTIEAKALLDFLLGGERQGNPTNAEIRAGISIPGIVDRYGLQVGDHGKLPEPKMLPMWMADP